LITAGLAVPLAGTASATDISKPISANGPALKLTFANIGDNGAITFSGMQNQVVNVTTSAGTYAANCDVMVSVLKGATTIAGPVCGGIAGTTGNFTLGSNATYTIKVDTQGHTPATLKVALTSTGAIKSITPNAAPVTFAVPASSTTDFGFIAKAGQRISATTTAGTFGSGGCALDISVIAPNGTTVLGSDTCAGISGYVPVFDSVGAGTYKLRVQNTAAPTGTVKLAVFQFKDKAGTITANGAAAVGKVGSPGQRFSLAFSGTNGQKISYQVTTSDLVGFVELHKPDGSYAGSYIGSGAGQYSGPITLTVTGTWTLVVYSNTADTGSATLKLYTFTDVNGGTIVANGAAKSLTIASPGQTGSFTFSGTAGQKISWKVTASDFTGFIDLRKPDGSYGGTYTGSTVNQFSGPVTLPTTGTWSLLVYAVGADTGSVTVQLYSFTDVAGGTIVANGAPKSLTITTPGQMGSFTFAGTSGQQLSWKVTASDLTGFIELRKPDGSYGGTYTGSSLNAFSDSFTLTVTGTWSLLVYANSSDTGSVTVQLYTFADVAGGTITPGGANKTVTITTPGQNGTLTFSGTNGDSRSFQVVSSTMAGFVELHRPDGSYAGTYSCLATSCTAGPAVLNVTGTWSLLIDPSSTSTGSATIKLT
jgi:hypothetical protein